MLIFTRVKLSSGIVCRQFTGAFRKQFWKSFGLDQPESIFTSEFRIKRSPDAILSCSFFRIFFLVFIFRRTILPLQVFRQQLYLLIYRSFHNFFALWWARNNFGVNFAFVYTDHALFTFHVLVACGGPTGYTKKFIFRKRLNWQSSNFRSSLKNHSSFMQYNHISHLRHTRIDFLRLKLGVISTAKTAHNQGANKESPKLNYKSYFVRHFYAVLKLWVTGKCMWNIKSIRAFACLYCLL